MFREPLIKLLKSLWRHRKNCDERYKLITFFAFTVHMKFFKRLFISFNIQFYSAISLVLFIFNNSFHIVFCNLFMIEQQILIAPIVHLLKYFKWDTNIDCNICSQTPIFPILYTYWIYTGEISNKIVNFFWTIMLGNCQEINILMSGQYFMLLLPM